MMSRAVLAIAIVSAAATASGQQPAERCWSHVRYLAKVDRKAAEDFGKVYVAVVSEVANRPTRPKWNDDSFFKRFAK